MKAIILCQECKVPYKPLSISKYPEPTGNFVCPKCHHGITLYALIEILKTFS